MSRGHLLVSESGDQFEGPFSVQPAPKAMVRFALGSAATIATLLCIPDGVGIMPDVADWTLWVVRVFGMWLSAYILWTAGFIWMLYFMRLFSGGIEIREDGIKLWRLGKVVPFEKIKALACEPQPFFGRAFCLPGTVFRLTFYQEKTGLNKKNYLAGLNIASFQFSARDFESLYVYMCQRCFGVQPAGFDALMVVPEEYEALKQTYSRGRLMRIGVSAFILLSLVSFLGRRAASNFEFNAGTQKFRQELYAQAEEDYTLASKIDPMFAPTWDRLARSEARQGKQQLAEKHWHRALELKPDFVEAKIGLSLIAMQDKKYDQAKQYLTSALRLSPTNVAAYLNLAQLQLLTNNQTEAIEILHTLLKNNPKNTKAHAMLAQTLLKQGDAKAAQEALANCDPNQPDASKSDVLFFNKVSKQVREAQK